MPLSTVSSFRCALQTLFHNFITLPGPPPNHLLPRLVLSRKPQLLFTEKMRTSNSTVPKHPSSPSFSQFLPTHSISPNLISVPQFPHVARIPDVLKNQQLYEAPLAMTQIPLLPPTQANTPSLPSATRLQPGRTQQPHAGSPVGCNRVLRVRLL